jgi:hypothetical protein
MPPVVDIRVSNGIAAKPYWTFPSAWRRLRQSVLAIVIPPAWAILVALLIAVCRCGAREHASYSESFGCARALGACARRSRRSAVDARRCAGRRVTRASCPRGRRPAGRAHFRSRTGCPFLKFMARRAESLGYLDEVVNERVAGISRHTSETTAGAASAIGTEAISGRTCIASFASA